MSEWRDRKGVLIPLGVLAMVVWSLVIHTALTSWQTPEPAAQTAPMQAAQGVEVVAHVWQEDFRDPFSAPSTVRSTTSRPSVSATPVDDAPLSLRLVGIVDGTAMLETAPGSVVLTGVGDVVSEARVVSISATAVIVSQSGRRHTLTMD